MSRNRFLLGQETYYLCGYCGAEFGTKKNAEKHERYHKEHPKCLAPMCRGKPSKGSPFCRKCSIRLGFK